MSACVILFTVHVFFLFFIYNTFICAPLLVNRWLGSTWWSSLHRWSGSTWSSLVKQVVGEHLVKFISKTGGRGAFGQVH